MADALWCLVPLSADDVGALTRDGKAAVLLKYPEDDPQCRECYLGSVVRQRPHGFGVLKWRKGNYVRFDGRQGRRVPPRK